MEKTCFVCDKKNPGHWLSAMDVYFCSEEHMKLFLQEWVQAEDPLKVKPSR